MTHDEWHAQAVRLEAAWPAHRMDDQRLAVYYEALSDLPADAVSEAISSLLREDREAPPAPGVIRVRAGAEAGASAPAPPAQVTGASVAGSSSVTGAERPAPARSPAQEQEERERRRPWMAILFSFLGLFPIGLWLGFASLRERRIAIAEGRKPSDRWAAITAIVLSGLSAAVFAIAVPMVIAEDRGREPASSVVPADPAEDRVAQDTDQSDGSLRPASRQSVGLARSGMEADLLVQMREYARPGGYSVSALTCQARIRDTTSTAAIVPCEFLITPRDRSEEPSVMAIDAYVSQDAARVYWEFGAPYIP